jgi:hypothetical protein
VFGAGEAVSTFRKRPKPLAQVGRKAQREEVERTEMRKRVIADCGGRCVARKGIPEVKCWASGTLDVHEVIDRSVRPGVALDHEYGIALCRAHHDWISENASRARERGFSFFSWDWEAALKRVAQLKVEVWTW